MIRQRVLMTVIDYDPELRAYVVPWTHALHTWIGLVFIFDDPDVEDQLIYLVSNWNGDQRIHVHQCKATTEVDGDQIRVMLDTQPDPRIDKSIRHFSLKP